MDPKYMAEEYEQSRGNFWILNLRNSSVFFRCNCWGRCCCIERDRKPCSLPRLFVQCRDYCKLLFVLKFTFLCLECYASYDDGHVSYLTNFWIVH
jgi:hypothetical protein